MNTIGRIKVVSIEVLQQSSSALNEVTKAKGELSEKSQTVGADLLLSMSDILTDGSSVANATVQQIKDGGM